VVVAEEPKCDIKTPRGVREEARSRYCASAREELRRGKVTCRLWSGPKRQAAARCFPHSLVLDMERPLHIASTVPAARLVPGYLVLTLDGKEVGLVDYVDSERPERIVIRNKGLFGKRQALSLSAVEAVNTEDGIVVLRLGSQAFDELARDSEPVERTAIQGGPALARDEEQSEQTPSEEASARFAGSELPREGHLLFVATPAGYILCEGDGAPPDAGRELESADLPEGRFLVTKVGPSPLPGDRRRCAYLQPLR